MNLGSSLMWLPNFVHVYSLSLSLIYIRGFSSVSREGFSVFLKTFNKIDKKKNDCCGAELSDPLVTGSSNHEANVPLLLSDLFLITFKDFTCIYSQ